MVVVVRRFVNTINSPLRSTDVAIPQPIRVRVVRSDRKEKTGDLRVEAVRAHHHVRNVVSLGDVELCAEV